MGSARLTLVVAVAVLVAVAPPPVTVAVFVTCLGALGAMLTVRVIGG